ncbi:hypothetical protein GS534_00840 [Rhodococcus hoagii]|nr:hypothetical protein [Prescottella equi]
MSVVDEAGKSVEGENTYWHRTLGSGYRQAEKLVTLGMAQWSSSNHEAPFPKRPSHLYAEYEQHEADGDYEWEHPEYAAKLNAFLKDRRRSRYGIASHKLCGSNDGWWVTREECEQALEAWEKAGRPDVDDLGGGPLGDTIPFLRAAAAHHGFRVW